VDGRAIGVYSYLVDAKTRALTHGDQHDRLEEAFEFGRIYRLVRP
jgi:hypothetical protein